MQLQYYEQLIELYVKNDGKIVYTFLIKVLNSGSPLFYENFESSIKQFFCTGNKMTLVT